MKKEECSKGEKEFFFIIKYLIVAEELKKMLKSMEHKNYPLREIDLLEFINPNDPKAATMLFERMQQQREKVEQLGGKCKSFYEYKEKFSFLYHLQVKSMWISFLFAIIERYRMISKKVTDKSEEVVKLDNFIKENKEKIEEMGKLRNEVFHLPKNNTRDQELYRPSDTISDTITETYLFACELNSHMTKAFSTIFYKFHPQSAGIPSEGERIVDDLFREII